MTCGIVVENAQNAVMPLSVETDLVFSWQPTTSPAQKDLFTKAINAAIAAGLKVSLKTERLNGYSLPLTMDMEVITLLHELALKAGHRNTFPF